MAEEPARIPRSRCRFCGRPLERTFADLGMLPLANAYVPFEDELRIEPFYPLHAYVCDRCYFVQLPALETSEHLFGDYAYFSSFSDSWLEHARAYAGMAMRRFGLGGESQVIEIASNDGYLLQYFQQAGIPVLGVEPARNVAAAAIAKGIPTLTRFFGEETACELAAQGSAADLLVGNNVLAHVPDLDDFVTGLCIALKPHGVLTMEFPHLQRLVDGHQFDTIYHEHFSYFSFTTAEKVFARYGLTVFDVEEIPTHGGSLRIYARHVGDSTRLVEERVAALREREARLGYTGLELYGRFAESVVAAKRDMLAFFIAARRQGKAIAGYGAPAKGSTLLNYCGIRTDMMSYTVDRSPHKQGRFLPGTRIPIYAPEHLRETRPDYVIILPWNLKAEIAEQLEFIREWNGWCVTLIPYIQIERLGKAPLRSGR